MTSLLNFDYKGGLIQKRQSDEYVNLTQMCQVNGKEVRDWLRLKSTKAYIEAVSSDVQICTSQLLVSKKGNSSEFTQGTSIPR